MLLKLKLLVILCAGIFFVNGDPCKTPNRHDGECVSLYDCPVLLNAFRSRPIPPRLVDFLRRSQCGFDGFTPRVCCSGDNDLNEETAAQQPATEVTRPRPTRPSSSSGGTSGAELPSGKNCGNDSGDRIYGGQITDIDEFPWMALLGYRSANGSQVWECGGVLINRRYVLTAAHCVVGEVNNKVGRLNLVRLGEYNTDTNPDCVTLAGGARDCADAHQDIPLDETIAHPGFSDQHVNRKDDIALLRLARDARITDFVQPICLPQDTVKLNVDENAVVCGWGRTLKERHSSIKLQLQIPIFDKSSCVRLYARASAAISDRQLCAGGEFLKDSCNGDSGGPLMRRNAQGNWESIGIVSFGNGCGADGWPGIYTNVEKYMDWIRENIRS